MNRDSNKILNYVKQKISALEGTDTPLKAGDEVISQLLPVNDALS